MLSNSLSNNTKLWYAAVLSGNIGQVM